eukprot:4373076-Heterocapsa_arctica.AAC.1
MGRGHAATVYDLQGPLLWPDLQCLLQQDIEENLIVKVPWQCRGLVVLGNVRLRLYLGGKTECPRRGLGLEKSVLGQEEALGRPR